jgi:hypothetical protein
MSYTQTITKTGAIYYYKIVDGKKVRISKPEALTKASPKKKLSQKIPKVPAVKIPKVKIPKIRIYQSGRGKSYPVKEGFKNYPIFSRGAKPWKELSPFIIGPVSYISAVTGKPAKAPVFENYWQAHKVWEHVDRQNQKSSGWIYPKETHIGKDGLPNEKWKIWHDKLMSFEKAVRRPNGKAVPKYSWWLNEKGKHEKLDIIDARKKIYIPTLKALYRAHPVYKRILKDFKAGQNIILIEPDGPWDVAYPDGREVTLDLLKKLIEKTNYKEEGYPNKYHPFGHGYVCALCLLEDIKN